MDKQNTFPQGRPSAGSAPNRRQYAQPADPNSAARRAPGRPLPPQPEAGYRQQPKQPQAPIGPHNRAGSGFVPRPGRRQERMETRPLDFAEPYTSGAVGEPPTRRKKKKTKALPILLTVVILLALVAVVFALLKPKGANKGEVLAYYENTNEFRRLTRDLQDSLVKQHDGLSNLPVAFSGYGKIALLNAEYGSGDGSEPQGAISFIDNAEDYNYHEQQSNANIGRLVIPSIRTNGPLADVATDDSLFYGFGIVDFMPDLDEEGMCVILGHRFLTSDAGMLYMQEMKEGDPYYIDDYRDGVRYIYSTRIAENITEEEYFLRFDPAGRFEGQSTLLVTCDPDIYDASERRILIYGALEKTTDIPADDEYYVRYQNEQGL